MKNNPHQFSEPAFWSVQALDFLKPFKKLHSVQKRLILHANSNDFQNVTTKKAQLFLYGVTLIFFFITIFCTSTANSSTPDPCPADNITMLVPDVSTPLENRIPLILIHGRNGTEDKEGNLL